jgi:superfamily II DNA or RNA helicase
VRDYQRQAAEAFYLAGSERGGSGVVVLPCGAGKTIVGLVAMDLVKQTTLVLTTSLTAVKQWRDHSTISRTRRLIDVETHRAVFGWVLELLAEKKCSVESCHRW